MRLFNLIRALLVVVLALLSTLAISIAAIVMVTILGRSPGTTQKLARIWGRLIIRASGVSVRVEGGDKLSPDRTYIFAANHQSQFDIFVLQGYLGFDFRWLAKKELFKVPIWGRGMRLAGYIPVDRSHGRAAMKSLEEAAARIASGTSVVIFPEGTRSRDGSLQLFKAGGMLLAIKSKVPMVPVAIMGTHKILPKGKLLAKPGKVLIRLGEPIEIRDYQPRQKHELAKRIRAALADMLENERVKATDDF